MKLTIIVSDKTVYRDGEFFSNLDLASVPVDVHALQWDGDKGWVEFVENKNSIRPENQALELLPDWANIAVEKWNEAKAAEQTRLNLLPSTT